ncbi:MAG: TatD family hydrolase [Ardenticatenaceae bacterium]|nr:TatD family hydrolase [Ardenticatenaceae bacterium]
MLIDAHTHIDMFDDAALPAALSEIAKRQIFTLSVTIDVAAYERAKQIAADNPLIVPLFGIHPWEAHRFAHDLDSLAPLLAETPMLGEIGLDFLLVKDKIRYPQQFAVFDYFLDTAVSQQKIVNIHGLGAETAVLERLEQFQPPTPIVHWYSGPLNLIDRYLAVGTYFTFGVELLHSEKIEQILAAIPPDRLLTETDNPGANQHFAQQPGTPALIQQVTAKMAHCRQLSPAELDAQLNQNFTRLVASSPALAEKWAKILATEVTERTEKK